MAFELCVATLDDYCTGKYTGSMPTELDALQQMTRGVDYIHSMHLIHGDIKPRNVLISPADDSSKVWLKMADFGCCKRLSVGISFSVSGIRKTPNFLAPELLELEASNDPSRQSDVFSLGCTFYVFLTKGSHPFGHTTLVVVNTSRGDYSLTGKYQNCRSFK